MSPACQAASEPGQIDGREASEKGSLGRPDGEVRLIAAFPGLLGAMSALQGTQLRAVYPIFLRFDRFVTTSELSTGTR